MLGIEPRVSHIVGQHSGSPSLLRMGCGYRELRPSGSSGMSKATHKALVSPGWGQSSLSGLHTGVESVFPLSPACS